MPNIADNPIVLKNEYEFVYFRHSAKDKTKQKKWQRILLSEIDAYREKNKNSDVFCTVQRFATAEKIGEKGEKEKHLCDVYFDFDSKDLALAQADIKNLIDFFCRGHDVPASYVRVYFSGQKGFHVYLDYRIFNIAADADLTYIIKHFAVSLKEQFDLKTLDPSVYSYPRQMRLTNSQHSKTKLYKIELSHDELNKSIEEILELAKTPREQIFDESEYEDIESIPSLASLYKKHYEQFKLYQQLTANKEPVILQTTELASCIKDMLENHIKEEGQRNNATMFLACYFKDSGFEEQVTIDTLLPWALRTPKDLMGQHTESELKSSTLSCIKSVYSNSNYHFYCNTMRNLGAECDYHKCSALKNKSDFPVVLKTFTDNYIIEDTDPIRVVFATVIANLFNADPVWLFLIAPPSNMKTEYITSLFDLSFVYPLSSLTAQTFASGMKGKYDASLLVKLNNSSKKILALKDFTSILSLRQEARAEILSQLREIYDGSYDKPFGSGRSVNWKGKLGLIAGVTTIIDTHYSVYQLMGERFIQYRIDKTNEMLSAKKSIDNIGKESDLRKKLKAAVVKYFENLQIPPISKIIISDELIEKISELACFCVKARSGVCRNPYNRVMEYIPDPEGPARLAKQLATLSKSFAVLSNRNEVSEEDYLLLSKIGCHCLPKQRVLVLKALNKMAEFKKTAEIAKIIHYPSITTKTFLEDLEGLEILDRNIKTFRVQEEGNKLKSEYSWRIKDKYSEIVNYLIVSTSDTKEEGEESRDSELPEVEQTDSESELFGETS